MYVVYGSVKIRGGMSNVDLLGPSDRLVDGENLQQVGLRAVESVIDIKRDRLSVLRCAPVRISFEILLQHQPNSIDTFLTTIPARTI